MPCIHEMAEYIRATDKEWPEEAASLICITAYVFNRQKHSYESLKSAAYPNADELERIYQEMMG